MEKKIGYKYPTITADAGYESEEAYTYLEEQGQEPYIKPSTYERWKKRSFKKDISKRENMAYDQETDKYDCSECPHMDKYKKSKNHKRLYVSKKFVAQREKSK